MMRRKISALVDEANLKALLQGRYGMVAFVIR